MPQHPPGQPGPTGGRTGTEPVLARSALGLRLVISSVAVPLFAAVTVLLSIWARSNSSETDTPSGTSLTVTAAVLVALTLIALVDLVIVIRRRSRAREAAREENAT